jgi:hypothetical protein
MAAKTLPLMLKTLPLMFVFAWVLGLSFALLGIPTETLGIPTEMAARVPSPIVGAGLPGLVVACGCLIALARRRRQRLT